MLKNWGSLPHHEGVPFHRVQISSVSPSVHFPVRMSVSPKVGSEGLHVLPVLQFRRGQQER